MTRTLVRPAVLPHRARSIQRGAPRGADAGGAILAGEGPGVPPLAALGPARRRVPAGADAAACRGRAHGGEAQTRSGAGELRHDPHSTCVYKARAGARARARTDTPFPYRPGPARPGPARFPGG